MHTRVLRSAIILGLLLAISGQAWELHNLHASAIFASVDAVTQADSVRVESLEAFLMAVESELAEMLVQEELWLHENLDWYQQLPAELEFKATGNPSDVRLRFFHATRLNPEAKLIPYLQLLPGEAPGGRPLLPPEAVTPLLDNEGYYNVTFVELSESEMIDPLHVLVTANHEPDLAFDIGLYADNDTEVGQIYGFGKQSFGNPNLEYGSQAPFHMGLYHEKVLINAAAPFLKECYPEYRIHQFKSLSELAFRTGHDYWGWRFMGCGLHYIADLANPYHAAALPGVSTFKMITVNVLDMMGMSGMKDRAIQLVSNRHLAIEMFERQLLVQAYLLSNDDYLQFQTLSRGTDIPEYSNRFPRDVISARANQRARTLDRAIEENFPRQMVSDPEFELGKSGDQYHILAIVEERSGTQSVRNLENLLNVMMEDVSVYSRSYLEGILGNGE